MMRTAEERNANMKRLLEKYPPDPNVKPYHISEAEQEADNYDDPWEADLDDDEGDE